MTNKEKMEKGLKCIKNKTLLIIFIVTFILSIVMGIISACMSSDNEPVIDTSLDSNKIAIDGEIKISSQSTGFNKYKTTITGELFNMTNENINDIQLIFYVSNYE